MMSDDVTGRGRGKGKGWGRGSNSDGCEKKKLHEAAIIEVVKEEG